MLNELRRNLVKRYEDNKYLIGMLQIRQWSLHLPNRSATVTTSSLSVLAATAHTRGLSTNVPWSLTFLPFDFATMNASVTVRARSISPADR